MASPEHRRRIPGAFFQQRASEVTALSHFKEFLAWAAQNKGKVSYGSWGIGSFAHLVGAYMSQTNGLDMAHVAYKGETPIVQDIVGGQIAWGIASIGTLEPHIASGRVRALVLFGERRSSNLPSVPTMTEAGLTEAEYRTMGWVGLLAPANTPAPTIDMLEKNARSAVRSPAMQAHFENVWQ